MNQTKPSRFAAVVSIVNLVLFAVGIFAAITLLVGMKNAERTGTFSVFGCSLYLNKTEAMMPDYEKNDVLFIKEKDLVNCKLGDDIAFYYQAGEEEYIGIRTLLLVDGTELVLTDGAGEELVLDAEEIQVIGKVSGHSAFLGKMVVMLQTDDGKVMFLWWCIGIVCFLCGITLLAHVLSSVKNRKAAGKTDYHTVEIDWDRDFE